MTDRFPLLRLPFLAIQRVVNHMNPHEIMFLALTKSSKAKNIVKYCSKHYGYKIGLIVSNSLKIVIETNEGNYTHGFVANQVARHVINTFGTYQKSVEFVIECTNAEVKFLELDLEHSPKRNREFVNWAKLHTPFIKKVSLRGKNVPPLEAEYLLEQLKIEQLHSEVETENNSPIQIPKGLKCLLLGKANWVTLDHLLNFDAVDIQMWNYNLTPQELNRFLNKVRKQECNPNMKSFGVQIDRKDWPTVVDGLEFEKDKYNKKRALSMKRVDGKRIVFYRRKSVPYLFLEMRILDE